jgi:PAS domain S-box-containing protein
MSRSVSSRFAVRSSVSSVGLDQPVSVVITTDKIGTILSANQAVKPLFGYDPTEILGKNVRMLMPPPYCDLHDHFMRRYVETGEARVIGSSRTVEALHRNGSTFQVRLSLSNVSVGDEIMFCGVIEPLNCEAATITINTSGVILSVNRTAAEMFNYEPGELVGQKINVLQPERYAAQHDQYLENYHRTGVKRALNRLRMVEGRTRSGHMFPLQIHISEEQFINGERYYKGELFSMETSDLECLLSGEVTTGTVRTANRNTALLFGFMDPQELIGLDVRRLLPEFTVDNVRTRAGFGRIMLSARHRDGARYVLVWGCR